MGAMTNGETILNVLLRAVVEIRCACVLAPTQCRRTEENPAWVYTHAGFSSVLRHWVGASTHAHLISTTARKRTFRIVSPFVIAPIDWNKNNFITKERSSQVKEDDYTVLLFWLSVLAVAPLSRLYPCEKIPVFFFSFLLLVFVSLLIEKSRSPFPVKRKRWLLSFCLFCDNW